MKTATLIFILVFAGNSLGQTNSWRGLTPLRSTRSDVERLLGRQIDRQYSTTYQANDATVKVVFSKRNCDHGWNVPKGTVLNIAVFPAEDARKLPEELGITSDKYFFKWGHLPYEGEYLDPESGLSFYFRNLEFKDPKPRLIFSGFNPKTSDSNLRCDGFPPYSPKADYFTDIYRSFSIVNGQGLKNLYQWFDVSLSILNNVSEDYAGYMVVYFDKKAPFALYEKQLDAVRTQIFDKRQLPRERLTVIEGGLRDDAEVLIYILSKNAPPPVPIPAFASPQFMAKRAVTNK